MSTTFENDLFQFIEKYMPLELAEKEAITAFSMIKTFKKGESLLKIGSVANEGYFVLKGCLRVFYIIEGEEKTTAFYTEFESLEPPDLLQSKPSLFEVACVEDSVVLVGDPALEQQIFEKFPRFETLCRILTEQLLAQNKVQMDRFKTQSPEQRYLHLLNHQPNLVQRVPQHQLASFLGIKPQSLSRIRKRLLISNAK